MNNIKKKILKVNLLMNLLKMELNMILIYYRNIINK